jgi:kynurenine formamidase
MCDHCVIETVKNKMLDRRDFFKGMALVSATVVAGSAVPAAAEVNISKGKPSDLTHELHENFPTYFGKPGVSVKQLYNFKKNGFNLNELVLNEHTGTHIDAPIHFSTDGQTVAEIPVGNLFCPLAIIDIREKTAASADTQVTPDDIKNYVSANGPIPDGACVAMMSGWDKFVGGDKFRNVDDKGKMHFPGFHVEATKMLLEETKSVGIAVDSLSLDHGISADFATHYAWLPKNRWGLECVANLDTLPVKGATLVVGAPKMRGGTGGPSRVMALS